MLKNPFLCNNIRWKFSSVISTRKLKDFGSDYGGGVENPYLLEYLSSPESRGLSRTSGRDTVREGSNH